MNRTWIFFVGLFSISLLMVSCKEKQYLTGYYTWEEFQQKAKWDKFVDEKYTPREKYMDSLALISGRPPVRVQIFTGTYCPDSKKWIPRFYKLKPELPVGEVEIISVDTTKKDERKLGEQAGLKKIPTFIFYEEDGKEIGRITEKPKGRLEKRLYFLLKKQ